MGFPIGSGLWRAGAEMSGMSGAGQGVEEGAGRLALFDWSLPSGNGTKDIFHVTVEALKVSATRS